MFVQISKVIGTVFPRIDVILSSTNNNIHDQLTLKLWNEKRDLIRTVQPGQLITVYAVTTGFYGQQKHVNSTDQTLTDSGLSVSCLCLPQCSCMASQFILVVMDSR